MNTTSELQIDIEESIKRACEVDLITTGLAQVRRHLSFIFRRLHAPNSMFKPVRPALKRHDDEIALDAQRSVSRAAWAAAFAAAAAALVAAVPLLQTALLCLK